jgi:hypothetical protein
MLGWLTAPLLRPQVWSYLRTSLACAGRSDLMPAVDGQELQGLLQALPLE